MSPGKGFFGLFWKVPEGVVPTLTADLRPVKEGGFSRRHIISLDLTIGMEMGAIQLKKYVLSIYYMMKLYKWEEALEVSMQGKKNLTCYSIKLLKGTFQLS